MTQNSKTRMVRVKVKPKRKRRIRFSLRNTTGFTYPKWDKHRKNTTPVKVPCDSVARRKFEEKSEFGYFPCDSEGMVELHPYDRYIPRWIAAFYQ